MSNLLKTAGDNIQFVLVCAVVIAVLVLVSKTVERLWLKDSVADMGSTKYITICAMLGALATVLHIFDFPVAFLAPVGCSFVVPASIIYHLKKTRKTAVISLITGTLVMSVFGSAFNAIYLIPAFAALYGMPIDAIIGMGSAINPAITSVWTLAIFAVAPLNLLKGVLISVPTMVLYKRISKVLHNAAGENYRASNKRQPQM